MWRKSIAAAALTCGLVLAGGGVASAHECFIPNRSDKGNANATHSGNWETLTLEQLFATAHGFFGGPALTPQQVVDAVDAAVQQGIPASFTVFGPRTLPASGPHGGGAADGKGIDHFIAAYAESLGDIYWDVQTIE